MKRTKRKARSTKAGRKIIAALTELVEAIESGEPLESRFTVRTVELPDPGVYDPAGVRRTRAKVGVSQALFAAMLGVSAVLVRSWEHGDRTPAPWARRLLDEVNRDPAHWAGMIRHTTVLPKPVGSRPKARGNRPPPGRRTGAAT